MSLTAPPVPTDAEATALSSSSARDREEYFRVLTEQSLDIITVLDANGTIRFESPSAERWTGWKREELLGRNAFEMLHPEDRERVAESFLKGLTQPGTIELVQYRFLCKDGSWCALESWGQNLLANEFVRGVVVYSRDVTERRKEELRRAALNQLIARLNTTETFAAAASAIASATDDFFGWDAFSFGMYGTKAVTMYQGLNIDIVDGKRTEVPPPFEDPPAGSLTARVGEEGAKLILRHGEESVDPGRVPFGDTKRRSASIIAVPVNGAYGAIAVLSLHSYTEDAYTREDLHMLQEIAGHCSAALERIRVRLELVENEQRYRSLVERLPVAVWVHQEGTIVFANRATSKLLHVDSPTQLLGRKIWDFVAPEFQQIVAERLERVARGEASTWMEQRVVRLDKTQAFIEVASLATTYWGKPAIQTILLDVSDRHRAGQRQEVQYAATRLLAQSSASTIEQFLRCICEGLAWNVGELYLVDGVTRGLQLQASVQSDGAPFQSFVEAMRGRVLRKGDGIAGKGWMRNQTHWIAALADEPGFTRRELAAWAGLRSAVVFPLLLRDEFAGLVVLFSTETRSPDPAIIELFKVLGAQFAQFLERNQIQQQLLQAQKMEAVGQLAGGVAHDFNNLLTIITGHSQIALSMPELQPQIAEELNQISGAVDRAANLTRQLLTFSRKQVMQTRPLRLDQVLNELAKMLRRIIGEQVTLTLQHAPNLPSVEGDVGMLEQVVMNLAVNARDAMPEGGDLLIRTETVTIGREQARHLPQAREGKFVRLEVRDTGCGMSPEVLSRVFEPFFTTKPVGQGTGLGLATAYGIVKQHNGWIEVDSHVGVGTTFRVLLPLCAEPAAATKSVTKQHGAHRGANETLLLVEDEPPLRRLARKLLERAGYTILEAGSGQEALALWDKHREEIRLVLTDMVMPGGMSGRELAMRLRADEPELRVIFTSGYTTEIAGNLLEREKIEFLAKPYSPQQLTQLVHDTLHDKQP